MNTTPTEFVAIGLTKGKWTIIDAADWPLVQGYSWHSQLFPNGICYAKTTVTISRSPKRQRPLTLHQLLMGSNRERFVDHINGDTLDNRRSNLRLCTPAENSRNRVKNHHSRNRFKGVRKVPGYELYSVYICVDGNQKFVGCYKSDIEAAKAYNVVAVERHGAFARLNPIPEKDTA